MQTQPCILTIDTSDANQAQVSLTFKGQQTIKKSHSRIHRAQAVLPLIEQVLKEAKLGLADVTSLHVHAGPGSFTGLRVGMAIANMLGLLLEVPVNNQTGGFVTQPIYQKTPTIS